MKKTVVIRESEGEQVPFFRGILVKSLVETDIPFDDAYDIANRIRDELRDVAEISTDDLRKRVARRIERRFGPDKRERYELTHSRDRRILVLGNARVDCFSLGVLRHSLKACAIPNDTANAGAVKVQDILRTRGEREIERSDLRNIVYRCLREHFSRVAADRYLAWRHFKDSGIPLILMIGGSTGVGKSTVAAELAYRLNVARIQSTDMMREVIRSYLTPEVAPTLQYSSFDAWRGLPVQHNAGDDSDAERVVDGYLSQVATMRPAIQAAMERAIQEEEHLILEGVHILPTRLDLANISERAIVIPLILSTIEKDVLRQRLSRRGTETRQRNASRYLEHLEAIWELQGFLTQESDAAHITVLPTGDIETTVSEVLDDIAKEVMRRFPPHPKALNAKD